MGSNRPEPYAWSTKQIAARLPGHEVKIVRIEEDDLDLHVDGRSVGGDIWHSICWRHVVPPKSVHDADDGEYLGWLVAEVRARLGMPAVLLPPDEAECREIDNGRLFKAIVAYKGRVGCHLREARACIEMEAERRKNPTGAAWKMPWNPT